MSFNNVLGIHCLITLQYLLNLILIAGVVYTANNVNLETISYDYFNIGITFHNNVVLDLVAISSYIVKEFIASNLARQTGAVFRCSYFNSPKLVLQTSIKGMVYRGDKLHEFLYVIIFALSNGLSFGIGQLWRRYCPFLSI